jgi:hypothetical protein
LILRASKENFSIRFNTSVSGVDVEYNQTYTIDQINDVTKIGTVEVKATHITGCVQDSTGNRGFEVGKIRVDSPFGDDVAYLDTNGNFSFALKQDFQDRVVYIDVDSGTYSTTFTINTSIDSVNLGQDCIVLEELVDVNTTVEADITSSDSSVYLTVTYDKEANYNGRIDIDSHEKVLLGGSYNYYDVNTNSYISVDTPKETSGSFSITKDGVYYIFQNSDTWVDRTFDGSISFKLDGVTYSVTLPLNALSTEAWAGFALEVYQGEVINIVELNQAALRGNNY